LRALEDLQPYERRRQRLGRLVVELAGDTFALVLLSGEDLLGHLLQQTSVFLQHGDAIDGALEVTA
jgi:hypothetical protein